MLHRLRHFILSSFAAATLVTLSPPVQCQEPAAAPSIKPQRRTEWLDRPWELRYVFYVTDGWASDKRVALRLQAKSGPKSLDRRLPEIFDPSRFFQSRDRWAKPGDGLSVVIVEFERDGTVKTANAFGGPLRGRLDTILRVSIAAGDHATQPRFRLGEWFMGLGDISTHWAPGLCGVKNMPSPFSETDTGYLYGPKFIISPARPTFGCREWAYQLYDPDRPYIDITSYLPKRADPDGPGTYIHEMIGWSGFDARKPIIGKHERDWYCLHECPGGDQPGLISDINAWATKNGWSPPKPPTRIPTFPDPPVKAGTYPQ